MDSIEKGIVELVSQHGIRKLVMGAAADKHYKRKMMDIRSKKAKYVCQQAPAFCGIQFICKGCLIYTREARSDTDTGQPDLMRLRFIPSRHNTNSAETGQSNNLRSIPAGRGHNRDSSNRSILNTAPFPEGTKELSSPKSRQAEGSCHELDVLSKRSPSGSGGSPCPSRSEPDLTPSTLTLRSPTLDGSAFSPALGYPRSCSTEEVASSSRKPFLRLNSSARTISTCSSNGSRSIMNGSLDITLHEKLQRAMAEAEKVTLWHKKAARDLSEAIARAQEELRHRRTIEEAQAKEKEELVKVKNQIDQVMEKLRIFQEQETSLKRQIAQLQKESVELQVERNTALKEAEELRNKHGDGSSIHPLQFSEFFSLSEIAEATQSFTESMKIGGGGYGSIYKGHLHQTEVAIKRLHSHCRLGASEFRMKVQVLSQLRHPNLVKFIGSCPEAFALIYEYLPNGSLEDRLRCKDNSPPLSWQTRISIAAELCSVLVYLHSSKPHSIVHGNLKPSNILLDANFVCKLSDFGICRVLCHEQGSNNNTTVCCVTVQKGDAPYIDPEFLETGVHTMNSDVSSFGIILLQLLTGRPPISLLNTVKYALDSGNLKALLEPLAGDWPMVLSEKLAHLGLRCCDGNQENRPDLISYVYKALEQMRASCGASSSSQLGSVLQLLLLYWVLIGLLAQANVHYYDFALKEANFTRLCRSKSMLVVNESFPGPVIRVRKGDTAYVTVHNQGEYGVTIHWHGVHQPRNPWSDGPEYVTQCPIEPGSNFTYEVIFSIEEGTLWWHAHSDWTRASVYGAIVVLPHYNTGYPFPQPDGEEIILLGSWYNTGDVNEEVAEDLENGIRPPRSDAYTINGQPGDFYACSNKSTHRWQVDYGKTYLLRLVNAAMNEEFYFAMAQHNLTVVGVDGAYIKPTVTGFVMITTGQTMDILVTANQPLGRYYMAAGKYDSVIGNHKPHPTAVLEYKGRHNPSLNPIFPSSLPNYKEFNSAINFMNRLRSLASQDHPVNVPKNITRTMYVAVSANNIVFDREGTRRTVLGASLNNVSWVYPSTDVLLAYYRNISGFYTTDFPDYPPHFFNFTAQEMPDVGNMTVQATKVTMLDYNEEVEIVFQGTNLLDASVDHPMHLHGYTFYVVGSGFGNFDNETDPEGYNLVDPPKMNTVSLPKNGWVVIRFKASNPGVWLWHCHFESHLSWGMASVIVVRNGGTTETSIREPPPYLPSCKGSSAIRVQRLDDSDEDKLDTIS